LRRRGTCLERRELARARGFADAAAVIPTPSILRTVLVLGAPALVVGCPSDTTPTDTGDTSSSSSSGDGESTTDPSTTTPTTDPDTSTTIDPDTSATQESSSSEEGSESGFVGCGDGQVSLIDGELCDGDNLDGRTCVTEDFSGGQLACNDDCTLDTSGCTFMCGDGEVQGDEQCEGNDFEGADCISEGFEGGELGCNADCTIDTSACENYECGDNLMAGPDEVCDGTDLDGESCQSLDFDSGTLTCLADCSGFDTTECFVCGDGVIDPGETCDGNALGGETCVTQGLDGGVLSCDSSCELDLSECVGCGNGDADPGEECDTNDFAGTSCSDLGFDGGQPTCRADCTIDDTSCAGLHTFCTSPAAAIGPAANTLTQSTIPIAGLDGVVIDVDVLVEATHTAVGDLDIDVRHVDTNVSVSLADDQCGANDDIDATFDQDAAASPACGGAPTISGAVLPLGNLDAYVGTANAGNGTWELSITDQIANNGGTLTQWCVAVTTEADDESFAYVTNDTFQNTVTGYTIADDGTLTEMDGSPFPTGGDAGFNQHPDAIVSCGEYIYVADNNSSTVAGFTVDGAGALTLLDDSPWPAPSAVGLACNDGFLFVSDFGSQVRRFAIDADGSLTELGTTDAASSTLGMTLHRPSNRLVVAGFGSQVSVFDIDGAGNLEHVPGSPFQTNGSNHSASISPDGAFVATEGNFAVNLFLVAGDGSLSPAPGSPIGDPTMCETVGLAWAPDSRRLFVGHRGCFPGQVMVYDVAADGEMTPVPGAPFQTGANEAVGLAVGFEGTRLYVSHISDALTSVMDIAEDGSLSPIAGSPFPNSTQGGHAWLVLR
jgi:6-phosphogluconolactonase (cycloisomerase 2 family)/subtilisin-like proprotein convertase family protein